MTPASRIALWLVPPPAEAAKLESLMLAYSPPLFLSPPTNPASFPAFHPHLTLLSAPSAIPLPTLLRTALPDGQRPIFVRFRSVEAGATFTTSVYLTLRTSDSDPLERLRAHLAAVAPGLQRMGRTSVPAFPHVSLCYVADEDREMRARVAEEIRGKVRNDADGGISLLCEGLEGEESRWVGGFDASEVWVVQIDGPVSDWLVADKVPLTGS